MEEEDSEGAKPQTPGQEEKEDIEDKEEYQQQIFAIGSWLPCSAERLKMWDKGR